MTMLSDSYVLRVLLGPARGLDTKLSDRSG